MKDCVEFYLDANGLELKRILNDTNSFFISHGISEKISSEQIMILSELTKFIKSYGSNKKSMNEVKIQINIDQDTIIIEALKSAKYISLENLEQLENIIQLIRGFQDPFNAYIEFNSKFYQKETNSDIFSRIVKIAYEGQSTIDFFIDDKNTLYISTVKNIYD